MVESKHKWKAWIYLSPAIIMLLIFTVWPIVNSVIMAFAEGFDPMTAIQKGDPDAPYFTKYFYFSFGFDNFAKVFSEGSDFLQCLFNTILLCVLTVPVSTITALLIAVALNSIKPLQKFYQTVFFLPYVTNSIAIGMVFAAMFSMVGTALGTESQIIVTPGIINTILGVFGLEPINWMNATSSYWANIAVMVIYIVWNALPFKILVLLGGLQGISKQYYDAAKVDGTSRFRTLTKITVPLLSPMLSYTIITSFIGGFKEYSSIVGIFGDKMGPVGSGAVGVNFWENLTSGFATNPGLNTMVGHIYTYINEGNPEYGYASAASLILFGIIFIVTMINLYVSKKNTHY